MELKEFDKLCLEFQKLKNQKSDLKKEMTELEAQIAEREAMILSALDSNDLVKFNFTKGLVSKKIVTSAKVVDEDAYREYMEGLGIWQRVAKINSKTLNAIVKQLIEEEEEKGNYDASFPGMEVNSIEKISLRSK